MNRRAFSLTGVVLALSSVLHPTGDAMAQTGWARYEASRCPQPFIYTGNPVYDMLDTHLRNWGKMHRDVPQALVLLNPALTMLAPPLGWTKRWETRFTFATAPPEAANQMGPWMIAPLCEEG